MQITYCYDSNKKKSHRRACEAFLREAAKQLPGFQISSHFCAGGIAVWGETWVKITQDGKPVVEAIVARDYTIIRQWDGKRSGCNRQLGSEHRRDPAKFAQMVRTLATPPFLAF